MDINQNIEKLRELIDEASHLVTLPRENTAVVIWNETARALIRRVWDTVRENEFIKTKAIAQHKTFIAPGESLYERGEFDRVYKRTIELKTAKLKAWLNELKEFPPQDVSFQKDVTWANEQIELLMRRFDLIVKQLRQRHDSRDTIDVEDEYDVQDLFHALLNLYFDDIREEEWTPSYGGSSSRIDFLVKEFSIAIEIKMTRKQLTNKECSQQLAIDKDHYRNHPSVKLLICFVYDPKSFIKNPRGFEKDLLQDAPLPTRVFVYP